MVSFLVLAFYVVSMCYWQGFIFSDHLIDVVFFDCIKRMFIVYLGNFPFARNYHHLQTDDVLSMSCLLNDYLNTKIELTLLLVTLFAILFCNF